MDSGDREIEWRDRKRPLWLLGLIAPVSALAPSTLVALTQVKAFWWLGAFVVFMIIPIIDLLVGDDGENPPDSVYRQLSADKYYRWCTYLFLPILLSAFVVACYLWADPALSLLDKIGLCVSVGVISGVGINAAHELGHRVEKHERWLAKVALAQTCYGHFFVEHNRGHHARVATPEDPASARFGEVLYEFLPRSVLGSLRSAWRLEADRMARRRSRTWSWRNDNLQAWAMSLVLFGVMIGVFGFTILPYLLLQAAIAVLMLETVNYVEHYGLLRQQTPGGNREAIAPRHSWNSDRLVTNVLLFHLQRHSDHHANPARRYQTLRSSDEAPQLPAGYATMVLLALVPPLWRRVMDPRVLSHYHGDVTQTNIHPRRHEAVLAAYGTPTEATVLVESIGVEPIVRESEPIETPARRSA
ncbi:alkane 1-monooxygenase [Skermania piniformis]|uniref:alkane 1-monooxygenase n=1 Tax=Skermania pinensis TaxID=39122 RepID=UPI000A68D073|nr:alkane 1-monooxygenase [Skermania piniformis]